MKKIAQRVLASVSIMPALAGAVALNASDAEAASIVTCPMVPFVPVVCSARNAAGVQEGVGSAQDQPVVDFLGVADTLANGAGNSCRAVASYPGRTVTTAPTTGLPLNTSAYPAGSAAGWYAEPAFPMTSITVRCF